MRLDLTTRAAVGPTTAHLDALTRSTTKASRTTLISGPCSDNVCQASSGGRLANRGLSRRLIQRTIAIITKLAETAAVTNRYPEKANARSGATMSPAKTSRQSRPKTFGGILKTKSYSSEAWLRETELTQQVRSWSVLIGFFRKKYWLT
jgi:hypothetical protein